MSEKPKVHDYRERYEGRWQLGKLKNAFFWNVYTLCNRIFYNNYT